MGAARPDQAKHKRWPRWPAVALAAALVALVALGGRGYSAPDNVHGAVYSWATANPGQDVPVLVQTSDDAGAVAGFIQSAGGSVRRQFTIIPVIEADVPPAFVASLAAHPGVALVSLDAPVVSTGAVDISNLATTYPFSLNADDAWAMGITGDGIGVAVVDTGISPSGHEDFKDDDSGNSRVVAEVVVNPLTSNVTDGLGHGTHIAGTVAGDGSLLDGKYIGVAPRANLINVKIADEEGNATLSDVIAGLEWVYYNRHTFNVRVVNLSLSSSVALSYLVDPLCAAAEFLWLNGLFVVAAAGNLGDAPDAVSYCPGNDPFLMTVGAIDDADTADFGDDFVTDWSSRGTTQNGFRKPELHTPGRGIVSVIDTNSIFYKEHPDHIVDKDYFSLSGTSMAAGAMSGAAALVLERHNDWTPGQVKCTLMARSRSLSDGSFRAADAGAAVAQATPSCNSDAGLVPSLILLRAAPVPAGVVAFVMGSPNSKGLAAEIGLDLAAANVRGGSVDSLDWSAIKWDAIKWDAIKWDAIKWDAIKW
ncbi:MAG: S8 family serine peptidase, partial [Chloroflexi bacterium]|nr:S8 family serine peptidase [Chloroflexota bacterium]